MRIVGKTTENEKHKHGFEIDNKGNGFTFDHKSKNTNHTHKIKNKKILSSDNHIHEI